MKRKGGEDWDTALSCGAAALVMLVIYTALALLSWWVVTR